MNGTELRDTGYDVFDLYDKWSTKISARVSYAEITGVWIIFDFTDGILTRILSVEKNGIGVVYDISQETTWAN